MWKCYGIMHKSAKITLWTQYIEAKNGYMELWVGVLAVMQNVKSKGINGV